MDDQELQDVRDIELRFPVDGVVECHVEVLATEGVVIEAGAAVHFHVHLTPDHELVEHETARENERVYRVRLKESSDGSNQ
jgi:acetyltransferase-like isoleucine patch superfamily enzyme